MKGVQVGDYLVAYLSRKRNPLVNGFFAVGRVIAPRQPAVRSGTVEAYVRNKQSHEYRKGIIQYSDAPVFYEDFNDKWRPHDDSLSRYAQRIDVEKWLSVAESGVPWLSEIKVGPSEQQRAIFQIKKSWFNKILSSMERSAHLPSVAQVVAIREKKKRQRPLRLKRRTPMDRVINWTQSFARHLRCML